MEDLFRWKDLPRNLTAGHLSPTNGPVQIGVALACIGVALFEVGVAHATPKVYKSPPLQGTTRALGTNGHQQPNNSYLIANEREESTLIRNRDTIVG